MKINLNQNIKQKQKFVKRTQKTYFNFYKSNFITQSPAKCFDQSFCHLQGGNNNNTNIYRSYLIFICLCIASISLKYNQQDATYSRSIYFYKLICMIQAVLPPIIRSTKLYILRQVLSKQYCCYRGWDGT
jgi:hypothetical protein